MRKLKVTGLRRGRSKIWNQVDLTPEPMFFLCYKLPFWHLGKKPEGREEKKERKSEKAGWKRGAKNIRTGSRAKWMWKERALPCLTYFMAGYEDREFDNNKLSKSESSTSAAARLRGACLRPWKREKNIGGNHRFKITVHTQIEKGNKKAENLWWKLKMCPLQSPATIIYFKNSSIS